MADQNEKQPWEKTHRELYPEQYKHRWVGKRVRVYGRDGVISRRVFCRFGELVILEADDLAPSGPWFRASDVEVIDE